MSAKITFRHSDGDKAYTENFDANDKVINTNIDSDTAQALYSFVRAVVNLSTDQATDDVYITETKSLTEIIYPESGENNG